MTTKTSLRYKRGPCTSNIWINFLEQLWPLSRPTCSNSKLKKKTFQYIFYKSNSNKTIDTCVIKFKFHFDWSIFTKDFFIFLDLFFHEDLAMSYWWNVIVQNKLIRSSNILFSLGYTCILCNFRLDILKQDNCDHSTILIFRNDCSMWDSGVWTSFDIGTDKGRTRW